MHPVTFPDAFQRTSQRLRVVAVIPARYASTRLPAKPLLDIAGRPMIEHVYRRAAQARGVDAVVVATDDSRIATAVERFGGVVRMTASVHRTGTDRIAELARSLACDIIVNVQGDLPLVEPEMIAQVIAPLNADASLPMATICTRLTDPEEYTRPSVVKVVTDRSGRALYFSRAPIPYIAHSGGEAGVQDNPAKAGLHEHPAEAGLHDYPAKAGLHVNEAEAGLRENRASSVVESGFSRTLPTAGGIFKHIGMYAYRRDFLLQFAALPQTPLEQAESLEQLRALEHGFDIRVVETGYESIEIDTPDDLERVRRLMARHSAVIADAGAQAATRA